MTADVQRELAEVLPEHQSWCHGTAHAECCGVGDCDCGVADSLDRLLPTVQALISNAEKRAAAQALRDAAHWFAGGALYTGPQAQAHLIRFAVALEPST